MTNDELLQQLQSRGLITEAIATRLRRDAIVGNESPEDIIGRERLVPDEQVASLKSELLKVPYKKIDPNAIDERLMGIVPEETARTYHAVPISLQDNLLIVGMLHPDDAKAQEAMKFIARQNHINLGVYLISYGDLQAALRKYSPYRAEVEQAVRSLNVKEGGDVEGAIELEGGDSADAPIIKIVADTFKEAVLNKASDVHVEPQQKSLRIRLRIDGDLREVASMPVELAQPITSRIKVISNLKIDETRVPQDGRFRAKLFDRDIDFRVATASSIFGVMVFGWQGYRESDLLSVTLLSMGLGFCGMFAFVIPAGWYFGLVRSANPSSGTQRRVLDASVVACSAAIVTLAFRDNLWGLIGTSGHAAGPAQFALLEGAAILLAFVVTLVVELGTSAHTNRAH